MNARITVVLSALALTTRAAAQAPTQIVFESLPFTATASPAVGDLNHDNRTKILMSVDNIGYNEGQTPEPLTDPDNPNAVYLWGWSNGALRVLSGWPRATRDATLGVSLCDLDGNGRDEILGVCSQDNYVPGGMDVPFVSRLCVWDAWGTPVPPWAPWSILPPNPQVGNTAGVAMGHSYAPAVGFTVGKQVHILQSSQGIWGNWDNNGSYYPRYGALTMWGVNGELEERTSTTGTVWKVRDDAVSRFSLDVPPVVGKAGSNTVVAAATNDGLLYLWQAPAGTAVPGWCPSAGARTQTDLMSDGRRAPVRSPIAAADLFRDGSDEILAASGDTQSTNNGLLYNNGVLYCWNGNGSLRWRYPSIAWNASFTSGIAVGRIGGAKDAALYIVAGDAAGRVTALNRNGGLRWQFETAPGSAPGQWPVMAEPVIGDVNGDGAQDVVVGGTNGYLYALDGPTGRLLWKVATPIVQTPNGALPEAILGAPALCDLNRDGRLDIVAVTWQRYYDAGWHGSGHLLAWQCGLNTFNKNLLDWPQFQRTADRAGRAGAF